MKGAYRRFRKNIDNLLPLIKALQAQWSCVVTFSQNEKDKRCLCDRKKKKKEKEGSPLQ